LKKFGDDHDIAFVWKSIFVSSLLSSFDGFFVYYSNCRFISSWVSIFMGTYATPTYKNAAKRYGSFVAQLL
jgi:hypothetical protein